MKRTILTETLAPPPHEILYHYTTQAGLLGIIGKKEIFATHTQYLNDRREYSHAVGMVREEIHTSLGRASTDGTQAILEAMAADLDGIESMNVCVSSFSEDKDSLAQWRSYGAARSGYAIGIRGRHLAALVSEHRFFLVRCIYRRSDQQAIVRALVEEVVEENVERQKRNEELRPPGGNLSAYLHRFAPILKDPSFEVEKEWRVISRPLFNTLPGFAYRPGESMLIPYYKFQLHQEQAPFEIAEVVIGPTPNPAQSARSVRSFLVSQDLEDVPVTTSAVPFRNW